MGSFSLLLCIFKMYPTTIILVVDSSGSTISVQFSWSVVSTLCDLMECSMPGFPVHHQFPEPTQTCPLPQWCHPTISSSVVPFFSCLLAQHQDLFQWVGSSHQVAKVLAKYAKLSISPSNEHPGLISFRMDWLDLLAVQGTLESFLQHHSSKVSILRRSAFFTVQLLVILQTSIGYFT